MTLQAYQKVAVIIPSLNPDDKLIQLLKALTVAGFSRLILVNDGSSEQYDAYFKQAEAEFSCTVLTHHVNQGKGRALKTAFNYLISQPDCAGAVTVDSDGQHCLEDIIAVAKETLAHPDSLIMGCRDFSRKTGNIPARSRFGNVFTSRVLHLLCGISLSDTQTGLRGFSPITMRAFLSTKGERFEYEMNMILDAKEQHISLVEVPIQTVYIEENRSSHFNPLKDSLRIYAVFSKFILSSLMSCVIDLGLFTLFHYLLDWVLPGALKDGMDIILAAYTARFGSCLFNYFYNRSRVFHSHSQHRSAMVRYVILAVAQITVSAFTTKWLHQWLKISATLLKMVVDLILFFIGFQIQRVWVFRENDTPKT